MKNYYPYAYQWFILSILCLLFVIFINLGFLDSVDVTDISYFNNSDTIEKVPIEDMNIITFTNDLGFNESDPIWTAITNSMVNYQTMTHIMHCTE